MSVAARRGGWRVEHRVGDVGELHRRWSMAEDDPSHRAVALCHPTAPALVLGSTQPTALVDGEAATRRGVDVVRRRSGGGTVLVVPGDPVWIDVWVPADDPLLIDDVGRAFWWLGDVWASALARLGIPLLSIVRTPAPRQASVGAVACFGTSGSGEVVTDDGRKVVGLAQRRSRAGSLFHTACLGVWAPKGLVDLLALGADERARLEERLEPTAVGLVDLLGADLQTATGRAAEAFLAALP